MASTPAGNDAPTALFGPSMGRVLFATRRAGLARLRLPWWSRWKSWNRVKSERFCCVSHQWTWTRYIFHP
ncbi:MAG: hypothetical protein BJ554DRAFT_4619 [Olpidium bornovanus]|uniref:Uncharacterized protein n=1 Tax=Olpidium bornovanus TaxID=278681 RepID=A0A8H8DF38_9FUNG|nr:MAG: hypothetical protein BJ554DRAFT_4619 [Olpidium bornovanus]